MSKFYMTFGLQDLIRGRLEAAWDDGNALGLDGWVGPERGTEPDEHAIIRREKTVDRLYDEIAGAIRAHITGKEEA